MADRGRAHDALVASVVARARIASGRQRRGLDRELRDHLEDLEAHLRANGCSDAELAIQVRRRFGDAAAVGDALAEVYARERALACAGWSALQLAGSFLIAALVIASFQTLAAVAVAGHVAAPAIASVCAAIVRSLERVWAKYAAFLGTAIPFTIAWALLGPLPPRPPTCARRCCCWSSSAI